MNEIKVVDLFGFIYITTNLLSGKKYIGQKRFDTHSNWPSYLGSGTYFLRALKKYGRENFSKEIISIAYSKEELDLLEIQFIKEHDAVNSNDYYNLAHGGSFTTKHFLISEETKKKMSDTRKGRILSEETKKKMSEGQRKRKNNRKMSEENKQILLKIHTKLNQEQAKEIRDKYTTGNYNHKQLAEEYNVKSTTVGRVIHCIGMYELQNVIPEELSQADSSFSM